MKTSQLDAVQLPLIVLSVGVQPPIVPRSDAPAGRRKPVPVNKWLEMGRTTGALKYPSTSTITCAADEAKMRMSFASPMAAGKITALAMV